MASNSTFCFAWVSSTENEFNESHAREDELIFSFELKHEEGQFAELELEIINPRIGLLAPGRPLWAWFSWHDGSELHPLFFGRLIGIPDDLFENIIKIKFVAKPKDYIEQQYELAESLRVLPFYDPLYVDESKESDPDAALEGYSALWHVDRITHEVTISDILAGEDGIAEFTQNDVFYDAVKMKLAGAPLHVVEITSEVEWTQCDHTGKFEMKTVPDQEGDPKVGGGVEIKGSEKDPFGFGKPKSPSSQQKDPTQTTYSWSYKNVTAGPHEDGDLMEESGSITVPYYEGGELTAQDIKKTFADPETGQGEEYSIKQSFKLTTQVPPPPEPDKEDENQQGGGGGGDKKDANQAEVFVATEVEQDRKERIFIRVVADVQPVLTEADEADVTETLSMSARDAVEAGAASTSSGSYFSTGRGAGSVEYLLMVARAHLLAGSRVVEVEWECPFDRVVGLSCRKNATIEDPRLPGGIVLGKIVGYGMTGNGDDGEFLGAVTINSAVGNGNAIVTAEGTPVYVESGYVDLGYQHYEGRLLAAVSGDMVVQELPFVDVGLQLPITADQILVRHEYYDAGASTTVGRGGPILEMLQTGAASLRSITVPPIGTMITEPPAQALVYASTSEKLDLAMDQYADDNPSWVEMEFKPVQDVSTEVEYDTNVTVLVIPKQIDLAAPSSP